jgi:hypothetical protein
MLQTLLSLRDFIDDDHKKQFAHLPYQLENCMFLSEFKECKDKVYRKVLHIFDSKLIYVGTIEEPHWIPSRDK